LIGHWKETAAQDGMLHACTKGHDEQIDASTSAASAVEMGEGTNDGF